MRRPKCSIGAALAAAVIATHPTISHAAAPASDVASNAAYGSDATGAWKGANPAQFENPAGTDNGGTGFGIWNFAGGYMGDSNNGAGPTPYGARNHFIDGVDFSASSFNNLGAPAFGLTNANQAFMFYTARAARPFNTPLVNVETISANFDSPSILAPLGGAFDSGGVLIQFLDGSGNEKLNVRALANSNGGRWEIVDGGATSIDTGIHNSATSDGSSITFTQDTTTSGTLVLDGQTFAIRSLQQPANPIASIRFTLYGNGSGNGSTLANGQRELFFNNLAITAGNEWRKSGANNGGNWSDTTHWSTAAVPSGVGATATFGAHSTIDGAATVNLDTARTVGTLKFTNGARSYTIAGPNTLTLDAATGPAAVIVQAGTHQISANLALNDDTNFSVNTGASLSVPNLQTTTFNLTKSGAGTLAVNGVRAGALSVNGGILQVTADGGANGLTVVSSLALAPGAALDLTDNDLVVNNGSFSTIRDLVIAGFNSPADGGITSSTSGSSRILALFDNALIHSSTWIGVPVGANAIIGKYTYFGDANFDGQVTGDDYTIIDSNLNTTPDPGLAWLSGDMNLDGIVTGDDYTTIDSNLGLGAGSPLGPSALSTVPEPASAIALALLAATLSTRRRRCRESP